MRSPATKLAHSILSVASPLALALTVSACGGDDTTATNNNNATNNNTGNFTTIITGTLVADGAGGAPDATGMVSIAEDDSGVDFLLLGSDFTVEMGPGDTQVFLAKGPGNIQMQRDADPSNVSMAIGTIANGFSGAAMYEIPATVDPSAFEYVIVWCPTAGINFGVAKLGEASSAKTVVRTASLIADGAGGAPDATGMVSVARDDAGQLYIQFGEDFTVEMGPGDTQLILARGNGNVNEQRDADAASVSMSIGTIANGATGALEFMIPSGVDVDDFDYAIVWCPTAGVNFGAAELPKRAGALMADGAGGAPDATGMVSVARDGDGMLTIALGADFTVEMGPGDTQLILARGNGNVNEQREANAASVSMAIGTVANGASGMMSFAVPADVDVDDFDYAIIWCPTAGVNFGAARLQ